MAKKKKTVEDIPTIVGKLKYKDRSAYGQGILSWKVNCTLEQNPYDVNTENFLHTQWAAGWTASEMQKFGSMMTFGVYENLDGVPNNV